MKGVLYVGHETKIGSRLKTVVSSIMSPNELVVSSTQADLSITLSKSLQYPEIIVLLASSQKELADILEMQSLLVGRKIILVLPDEHQDSFSMGCRLFPRFMCDKHSNFNALADVLTKMKQNEIALKTS